MKSEHNGVSKYQKKGIWQVTMATKYNLREWEETILEIEVKTKLKVVIAIYSSVCSIPVLILMDEYLQNYKKYRLLYIFSLDGEYNNLISTNDSILYFRGLFSSFLNMMNFEPIPTLQSR